MKTIIVGADPFPPYQYYDDRGQIQGLDYMKVKSVIDKMGYKAEYIINDWSKIEDMLVSREIDMAFQVQKTSEREEIYYFSEKLRDAATVIVTSLEDTSLGDINDLFLDGGRLGVIDNYKYGEIIDSIEKEKKIAYKSLEKMLDDIDNGLIPYGVADLGVFNYLNEDNTYKNISTMEKLIFNRPLYVVFNGSSLRDKFNQCLR
ncbi:MAG: transporter substrate-binding domain-containing protein [Tissierellaceae bacterium]